MTGGPRGTTAPLDLKAIEARLKTLELADPAVDNPWDVLEAIATTSWALLAHARALRAALATILQHGRSSISLPSEVVKERNAAWERAAAVLGAAQDGPA